MITGTAEIRQVPGWQSELAAAVTDPQELLALVGLGPEWAVAAEAAARAFPLKVPRAFIGRMRRGDPQDPLLRQVLPLGEELQDAAGFSADPVGDALAKRGAGVLHKYSGRVLLTTTGACAVHCRYCFRRHYPYNDENASIDRWQGALDYVAGNPGVNEVILSGGDPLMLSDRRLVEFVSHAAEIPHLVRLRVHSRLPVVLPSRMTRELVQGLTATRLPVAMVLHVNHANELDESVRAACARLRTSGVMLLNQSVLLRGVNDNAEVLSKLSEALFAAGVLPYYLHLLDRVQGAAHFEVPEERAMAIHRAMTEVLPGYLVPRLVRDEPGANSKRWMQDFQETRSSCQKE